jgi:arylsulfatase A-like enzyme
LNILARNGYKNFYYGKWHAGPGTALEQNCEGFSYSGYSNPYTKPEYIDYLKKKKLPNPTINITRNFMKDRPEVGGTGYVQDRSWCNEHAVGKMNAPKECHEAFFLAEMACDKLEELSKNNKNQPFHLRVDFWGPHPPYFPTQEFIDMYNPSQIPMYESFSDSLEEKPKKYKRELNLGIGEDRVLIQPNPMRWEDWQHVLAYCYAHITMVDDAAGKIINKLDELGFGENTMVIYTTDHGDAVACHGGHFDKASYLCEAVMRIPMAIRYPNVIESGEIINSWVSNLDIAPTILDAAGLSFTKKVDGSSLLKIFEKKDEDREDLMCESYGHGDKEYIHGRVLYYNNLKYVYNYNELDELYDLKADKYEMNNLVNNEEYAEKLNEMIKRLKKKQKEFNDPFIFNKS